MHVGENRYADPLYPPGTYLCRTYARGPVAVRVYHPIYNTTRVNIHMACICEEKGVGYHMELLRSSTLGEYIQIYIKIYKGPQWDPFFPFNTKF